MISRFLNALSSLAFWNILFISSGFISIFFHLVGFRPLPLACYVVPMMTYYIFVPLVIVSLLFGLLHYRYPKQKNLESLSMLISWDQTEAISPYVTFIGGIISLLYAIFWEYRYIFTPFSMIESAQISENLIGSMYIRITIVGFGLACIISGLYHLSQKTKRIDS